MTTNEHTRLGRCQSRKGHDSSSPFPEPSPSRSFSGDPTLTTVAAPAPAHTPPLGGGHSSRQEGEAADLTRALCDTADNLTDETAPTAQTGVVGAFRQRQRFAITERDLLRGYGNAAPWSSE